MYCVNSESSVRRRTYVALVLLISQLGRMLGGWARAHADNIQMRARRRHVDISALLYISGNVAAAIVIPYSIQKPPSITLHLH